MFDVTAIKNFRANLRSACEDQAMSQRALGEKSGIAYPNVNRILQGKVDPTLSTCEKLANAVGVPLEDLLKHPLEFDSKKIAETA